jgi:predicted dehydrogenase
MSRKIRWGTLGCANIAIEQVLPAIRQGKHSEVYAIASRDPNKAKAVAEKLGIPVAYGSYEELLGDPDVEAVYIPLPNHLHVEWTIKAIVAGKHVLCEKPFAMTRQEALEAMNVAQKAQVKVGEAFMIRNHPQWIRIVEILQRGDIGEIGAIQGSFTYFNDDAANVRNIKDIGGGGLYDIGCYPIMAARMVLGVEPVRVCATASFDPNFKTDRVTSVLLEFPGCTLSFMCATQLARYQSMQFHGTKGVLEVALPFNPSPDRDTEFILYDGSGIKADGIRTVIEGVDQYTLQADAFSRSIIQDTPVSVPLENALSMASVYETVFRSIKSGRWETIT